MANRGLTVSHLGDIIVKISKKNLLCASALIAVLGVSSASFAQEAPKKEEKKEAAKPAGEVVVVTGSRIGRSTFNSTAPLTIVTTEQSNLKGQFDPGQALQQSAAAAGSTQINAYFTGFVVDGGGPGVSTIALRGLGPGRTLVLFDGKRLPPSGARGQVGAVDLNTLPSLIVDRTEVLRDGSSPIYGSEAIGGVVNLITRKNVNGFEVSGSASAPFAGGAEQYRVGALWGKTLDKSAVTLSAEYIEQKELNLSDRDFSKCVDDYIFKADGTRADYVDPKTGKPYCFNGGFGNAVSGSGLVGGTWVPDSTATAITVGYRPDAIKVAANTPIPFGASAGQTFTVATCVLPTGQVISQGNGTTAGTACTVRLTIPGYRRLFGPAHGTLGSPVANQVAYNSPFYDNRDIFSPSQRFTVHGRVSHDFDFLGGVSAELSGFYNIRKSSQESGAQLFPTIGATNVYNPFGATVQPVMFRPANAAQEIHTFQIVGELKGKTGNGIGGLFKNGSWDLSYQYGKGDGDYTSTTIAQDRLDATLATTITNGVASCPTPVITGGTCLPINFFTPDILAGKYTPEQLEYLFNAPNDGNTVYVQQVLEGNYGGEIYQVPGAKDPISASVGFHLRKYSINDVPGATDLAGNRAFSSSAGITKGEDQVREFYGEVEAPLISKKPFFDDLTVNLAYRWTEYDSYPSDTTYKASVYWKLTPEFRIRGGVGTSYKAPALYELFLGDQTAFLGQGSIDPCINWDLSSNPTIVARCSAAGIPAGYIAAGSSSALIVSGGGYGVLKDERANTKNFGIVYDATKINLRVAVDWTSVENTDQVAKFGAANIAAACYGDDNAARAAIFCSLLKRNSSTATSRPNEITQVDDNFVNINNQNQEEIALAIDYKKVFSFGTLAINSDNTFTLRNEVGLFSDTELFDNAGTIGEPKFVSNNIVQFRKKDWTFNWNIDAVGPTSNKSFNSAGPIAVALGGYYEFNGISSYYRKNNTETTIYHGVSVRYRSDNWTVSGGVSNIFDEAPPAISLNSGSARLGRGALASQYDLRGRSIFATVTRRW